MIVVGVVTRYIIVTYIVPTVRHCAQVAHLWPLVISLVTALRAHAGSAKRSLTSCVVLAPGAQNVPHVGNAQALGSCRS